jgi:hypothetical protein
MALCWCPHLAIKSFGSPSTPLCVLARREIYLPKLHGIQLGHIQHKSSILGVRPLSIYSTGHHESYHAQDLALQPFLRLLTGPRSWPPYPKIPGGSGEDKLMSPTNGKIYRGGVEQSIPHA